MSIKLTIKEKEEENNEWINGDKVEKSQIIDSLIKDIVSDVFVEGIIRKDEREKPLKEEIKEELEIWKDRLEKEEEKIDKLEEKVEILEDKLEDSKNIINNKLDEILSILKGDLNKNCQ
jgi:hypothetical protein